MSKVIPFLVAGSGFINLISLMGGPGPTEWPDWLRGLFPLRFAGISRSVTLLLGFALILSAFHLWGRKRRALRWAISLASISVVFHLTRGWETEEAVCSALVALALWLTRNQFWMGSGRPKLGTAIWRAALAVVIAAGYGAVGFWLLERHEFGLNFHWWQAAQSTLRIMILWDNEGLVPLTPYAAWFLDSLYLMSAAALAYGGMMLFRPVADRFHREPGAQLRAERITQLHGRSGQDFFKHASDKSYFFSSTGQSYISYRVVKTFALAFGDPVGPEWDAERTIEEFVQHCHEHGWRVGFHQVHQERLPVYERLHFRRMKIGEDAIVDLREFSLQGSAMKEFRNTVNRLDRLGYRFERFAPPVDEELIAQLKQVSDEWLCIPGHRERQFTLGRFELDYVRSVPVYVVFDPEGKVAAFLNLIPSYSPGLATVDLMRRRSNSINGVIDYLFAKVFLDLKSRGYERFSLGMAPLAEYAGGHRRSHEERVLRWGMRRLPGLFRAATLERFKAKYADEWHPRYSVYEKLWDLPKLALALRRLSELPSIRVTSKPPQPSVNRA